MKFKIPTQLKTPRLTLRIVEEKDWMDLHAMFSDEECIRHTTKSVFADWQTWRALATYLGHWQLRGYGPYVLEEMVSKKVIGVAGLWFPGDWPEPEIKWSLTRKFWNQGFASESAKAVQEMARKELGWDRLMSLILPENSKSISVAKRIGGRFEKNIPFRDSTADMYVYDLKGARA